MVTALVVFTIAVVLAVVCEAMAIKGWNEEEFEAKF